MTDIEQLKYIVENGFCHVDIKCLDCSLKNVDCGVNYDMMVKKAPNIMVKEAKKLLRIKKLERIIND